MQYVWVNSFKKSIIKGVILLLVKYGNKGKDVKWVQESLNKLGFNCGTVDGIFGSRTYSGVVAFQKYYSLTISRFTHWLTFESSFDPVELFDGTRN